MAERSGHNFLESTRIVAESYQMLAFKRERFDSQLAAAQSRPRFGLLSLGAARLGRQVRSLAEIRPIQCLATHFEWKREHIQRRSDNVL